MNRLRLSNRIFPDAASLHYKRYVRQVRQKYGFTQMNFAEYFFQLFDTTAAARFADLFVGAFAAQTNCV